MATTHELPAAPCRADFPAGFRGGCATSADPIGDGGDADADGRGESIWDRFCLTPDRIRDGSSGASPSPATPAAASCRRARIDRPRRAREGLFCIEPARQLRAAEGYTRRFGLTHVDFETQRRALRASGHWYRDFLRPMTHD